MTENSTERARRMAEHGYANPDDVLRLISENKALREATDPVTGAYGLTDSDIRSMLGEGFHTAFRKAVDEPEAVVIHKLIRDMDREAWAAIINYVATPFIKWLREAQEKHTHQLKEQGNEATEASDH